MAMRGMSDETLDGIVFGMALANRLATRPEAKRRASEYRRKLQQAREIAAAKDRAELIADLRAHNPAYVEEWLSKNDVADLRDRHAHTFWRSVP